MADTHAHEQAVADELDRIGPEIGTDRYPHETNDEYGYRLIAVLDHLDHAALGPEPDAR